MRLAIYENNSDDLKSFSELIENLPFDFTLDTLLNYEDFTAINETNPFDVVFVDFSDNDGRKIASSVQRKNPKQKVVLLSDSFGCLDNVEDCNVCKETYNILRIVKPLDINDVPRFFSNRVCEFDFYDNRTVSKLMHISKKYNRFTFDRENLQIHFKESNRYSLQAIDLYSDLAQNNIQYTSYDEYIQIEG